MKGDVCAWSAVARTVSEYVDSYVLLGSQRQGMVVDVASHHVVAADHVQFGPVLGRDGRLFKTRSGATVRLADLLDEAQGKAAEVVAEQTPDIEPGELEEPATDTGIAAIKCARSARTSVCLLGRED